MNVGLHSVLRGKLNRLARRTKGYYSKTDGMLTPVDCVSVAEVGLDLAVLHVLRIPIHSVFSMVSGIEFEFVAEDQRKQIHQHIHALCASLCPTNQPVQFAAQHRQ